MKREKKENLCGECPRCGEKLGSGLTLVPTVISSDEGTCSYGSGEFKVTAKCRACGYSRGAMTKANEAR